MHIAEAICTHAIAGCMFANGNRMRYLVQDNLGSHLAVLAVQPEMGVSEFCTFMGGYLPSVREMRFVRRDDAPRGDCLVLIQFDDASRAARFYRHHNNKPVHIFSTPVPAYRSSSTEYRVAGELSFGGTPLHQPQYLCLLYTTCVMS